MTHTLYKNGKPAAVFVIERRPGEGYAITNQQGPESDHLKTAAVHLLDVIGQPDPAGPKELHKWLGPVGPTGHFVGVTVHLFETGQARFHQSWFRSPQRKGAGLQLVISLVVLCLLIGVLTGATVGHLWAYGQPNSTGRAEIAGPSDVDTADTDVPKSKEPMPTVASDLRLNELRRQLSESRRLRQAFQEFLEQEGLAKGKSQHVYEPITTVRIIGFVDWSLKKPRVEWDPLDVRKMLDFLETVSDVDNGQRLSTDISP